MKYLIVVVLAVFIVGCNSDKKTHIENQTENRDLNPIVSEISKMVDEDMHHANRENDYQVALDFINSYIDDINEIEGFKGMVKWTKASALVTDDFKMQLETLVNDALAEDPIMGLGFDPFFDAQDYPSEGFELLNFDVDTGYVMVKGVDWDFFHVVMKVVVQDGHPLVDGCGVINIPKNKRAER